MNAPKEFFDTYNDLVAAIKTLQRMNDLPGVRSRELSLAITNLQQGEHWLYLGIHVIEDSTRDPKGE